MAGMVPGSLVELETMSPTTRAKKAKRLPDLDFDRQGIKVLQTRLTEERTEVGVVFIPDRSREFLKERMKAYGASPVGNSPRPHISDFEVIDAIRAVGAEALFVGKDPFETPQPIWWELWILREEIERIAGSASRLSLDVHPSNLMFPDVGIVFVHATSDRLRILVAESSGNVVEIRKATSTPEAILDNSRSVGQADWVEDLLQRMNAPPQEAPAICVHDTGIAAAHPLIAPGLLRALAYDNAWGTGDHGKFGGHGTPMGGVILHNDLFFPFQSGESHNLAHWLESMKILPPSGFPLTEPASYGDVTVGAIAKIELEDPGRVRAHCLAITDDVFDPRQPSTWSAAIDQACAGSLPGDDDGGPRRLFLIASGNTIDEGKVEDVLPVRHWKIQHKAGMQ